MANKIFWLLFAALEGAGAVLFFQTARKEPAFAQTYWMLSGFCAMVTVLAIIEKLIPKKIRKG